jgi:hypothetical protein
MLDPNSYKKVRIRRPGLYSFAELMMGAMAIYNIVLIEGDQVMNSNVFD